MSSMVEWVLDASAVLAYLKREPGGQYVGDRLDSSVITSVNLAEVATVWTDMSNDPSQAHLVMDSLPCEIAPIDRAVGIRAGLMRHQTRSRGLSLGDRICLAFAESIGLAVLTADRPWAELDIGVDVRLIR